MGTVGVGIAGLSAGGGWAATGHVPALAAVDGFELRGLSASSAESAKAAGERYGVPLTFGSVAELAAADGIDLVVVAVRTPRHRGLVLPALAAGKAVLCEWPVARSAAEADELAAAAGVAGVRTAVGLQARSNPTLRYLRDLVADGYVGEVRSTTVIGSGMRWGPTYDAAGAYQLDPVNGTTLLSVPFAHTLDPLTMVLGDVVSASATVATRHPQVTEATTGEPATMTVEDQVAVVATLSSGAVADLHFRGGRSRATDFWWEINGTGGDLVVRSSMFALWMGRLTLLGARGSDSELRELPVPASYELPALAGRAGEPAYGVAHAYAALGPDLAGPVPDFAHGARLLHLLDDLRTASATGTRIAVAR